MRLPAATYKILFFKKKQNFLELLFFKFSISEISEFLFFASSSRLQGLARHFKNRNLELQNFSLPNKATSPRSPRTLAPHAPPEILNFRNTEFLFSAWRYSSARPKIRISEFLKFCFPARNWVWQRVIPRIHPSSYTARAPILKPF